LDKRNSKIWAPVISLDGFRKEQTAGRDELLFNELHGERLIDKPHKHDFFIRNSALALAGATFIRGMLFAENQPNAVYQELLSGYQGKKSYTLKNVLLETGFEYGGDGNLTATKTGLFVFRSQTEKSKISVPTATVLMRSMQKDF